MRTTAERRHNDVKKAIRKRKISRSRYRQDFYNNLHQYSKNKVHCSCPTCTPKTKGICYGDEKGRHNGRNWKLQDWKNWIKMNQLEDDYLCNVA